MAVAAAAAEHLDASEIASLVAVDGLQQVEVLSIHALVWAPAGLAGSPPQTLQLVLAESRPCEQNVSTRVGEL